MSRLPAPRKWRAPARQPDSTARRFASAILAASLGQAAANARGALESADPEYVHQLRVGLRRYRSALRLFGDFMRGKPRTRLERRAEEAMGPLGATRDLDVCVAWLRAARAPQPVVRRAELIRDALRKSLTLVDADQLDAGRAWKKKDQALEEFRERALHKARRKVAKRARHLDWDDAKQRHRLRIAVKRLRYTADFLGAETDSLRKLQDSLGELNDLAVIRRLLPELAAPATLESKLAAAERRLLARARKQVAALELKD